MKCPIKQSGRGAYFGYVYLILPSLTSSKAIVK